jgi:osmotically-inducible protein OsmY
MDQSRQFEQIERAPERPAVQKFRFGASIQASDGDAGKLVAVIIDSQVRALTHVGIRIHQFDRHLTFVSLDYVTTATAACIALCISRDEMKNEIAEGSLTPPRITLTASTRVKADEMVGKNKSSEWPLGRLRQFTIGVSSRAVRHLVVARSGHAAQLLPAELITDLTAERITIRLEKLPLDRRSPLQPYRLDEELGHDVFDKLYDSVSLRVDLPGIEIYPIDGAVWLQGHVSNDSMRRLAEEVIQGIPGLSAVHNELVADDTLAAAASTALAHDPRTSGAGQYIGVYPRLGEIHLRGSVQTAAARERASTIALAVPAVKRVVNELHVDPHARELHDLAGVTNEYDLVPGGR